MEEVKKEHEHVKHIEPYSPQFGAMMPLGFQKWLRTCVIYQLFRFVMINIKMTVLILKSHH